MMMMNNDDGSILLTSRSCELYIYIDDCSSITFHLNIFTSPSYEEHKKTHVTHYHFAVSSVSTQKHRRSR